LWVAVLAVTLAAPPASAEDARRDAPDLKFASFFRQPIGARGLAISDALRAADGRRVRLVGYMVAQEEPSPGRFLLTPRPLRMSEHADGDADDLPPTTVTVLLDERQSDRLVRHREGLLAITGQLQVGRDEDPTTGRVSWVRLRLEPGAVADSVVGRR
jgi:hypothetical protein